MDDHNFILKILGGIVEVFGSSADTVRSITFDREGPEGGAGCTLLVWLGGVFHFHDLNRLVTTLSPSYLEGDGRIIKPLVAVIEAVPLTIVFLRDLI